MAKKQSSITPPIIDIRGVSKSIGDATILKDISLSIQKGRIAGIIGKSGAGKTTLLRCLNSLDDPSSGQIHLFGEEVTALSGEKRQGIQECIGTIFQQFNLLSRRTVLENIALPLEIRGVSHGECVQRARQVLDLVGLSHKENAYPRELSGGQCQRVAIARAIVADVSLLLCDEFTSALDPETTLEILELLSNLRQKLGLTIVLITHDMNVVREICDDVFVLDQGELVESGTIDAILLRPQHETTKTLIGSLFQQDLPHRYQVTLKQEPFPSSHVLLQLIFADIVAREPLIASLVEKFHVPINIIAGHLDHIREIAFGRLIVSFPCEGKNLENVQEFLLERQVLVELLGYVHA